MKIVGKIEDLLKKAVAHQRNDEWGEVERLYHRILQNDSMHPDAYTFRWIWLWLTWLGP